MVVTIHDHIVIADKGDLGGFLIHTLTPATKQLEKPEWDAMRVGMVCMSAKDFGEEKSDLEKLCSWNNSQCTVDQTEQVKATIARLDRIMLAATAARAAYEARK